MVSKKAVDMANLRLAMSENNKKVKECVQSSEKTLQNQVDELKESAVTPEEKASWKNQNAFSAIVVEGTKVKAQDIADTLALTAGDNVSLVPDPNTKQIVIKAEDTKYTHPESGVSAGTYTNVTVDEQGHVVAGNNPTTLSGYGITDAEEKGAANSAVSAHNTATEAHNDIRELINGLTTRLNALANSDDTTLDQMKEVVAYIKNNRTLIESVTTNKVNVSDIINNLTTNVSNKPLSAAQGVIIKGLLDTLESIIENHMDNTTVHVTSTERTNWDDANAKKHSHSNKSVLDKITSIDTALSASSENPVQNKVIHAEVEALKKSVSDGKTAVANAITGKGVTTATDATFATMATNINNIKTLSEGTADATATASQVLKDKTAYVKGSKVIGTMPNNSAVTKTITPSTSEQSYTIPKGYHDGGGKVIVSPAPTSLIDGDAVEANVLSGKKFFVDSYTAKTGTMPNNGAVAPSALGAGGSYTIPKGYHDGSGKVTVQSLATMTASADATAAQILSGKKAYVDGSLVTGTMTNRGTVSKTITGKGSYTIPAGYHNGSGKVTAVSYPNGKTWTASNITSGYFYCLHYADGIWVAGNGNGLYYSTDGKIWTASNITGSGSYFSSVFKGNNRWVAGNNSGIYHSTDGKSWTQITTYTFLKVYYANGLWVAYDDASGSSIGLYYSTNGTSWTQSNITSYRFAKVHYADGLWVACSENNKGIYYSTDGKTWTASNITSGYSYDAFKADGIWVAGCNTGLYYSTDGKTWTKSNITGASGSGVYYADGLWVAGSTNGTSAGIYYSTNGTSWTQSNITSGGFNQILYANGMWVMCDNSGNNKGIYYSTDGKSWTKSTSITSTTVDAIFNAKGVWVIACSSNKGLYYSITWA
jgi:hypothetical protein